MKRNREMLKKLFLSFLCAIVLLLGTVPSVYAQGTWYNQGLYEWYVKVYDVTVSPPEQIFGERYTAAQVDWIIYSLLTWPATKILKPELTACLLGIFFSGSGDPVVDLNNCLGPLIPYNQQESEALAINKVDNDQSLWEAIFAERQLSGITYVKERARKFKLIPEAQAQGFGFTTALDPFRGAWQVSRDISYGLFVIAAVVLAFMVMFRVKISPQTIISAQSAIPKLIIALLLVTFSYAIAGFMVDLMYVVIGLLSLIASTIMAAVINSTGLVVATPNPANMFNFLIMGEIPALGINLGLPGILITFGVVFLGTLIIVLVLNLGAVGTAVLAVIAGIAMLAAILTGGAVAIILLIIFFILLLIATVLYLWIGFKIWWMLVKAFVYVLLLTIFAPFLIVLGVFISSLGFAKWIRDYISNLAIFVTAGFLILMSFVFLGLAVAAALSDVNFLSVLLGVAVGGTLTGAGTPGWPPLLNPGVSTQGFLSFTYIVLSLVVFFLVPKAAEMIKSMLGGRPLSYGTAIGEAVAPIPYLGTRAFQVAQSPDVAARFGRVLNYFRRSVGRAPQAP